MNDESDGARAKLTDFSDQEITEAKAHLWDMMAGSLTIADASLEHTHDLLASEVEGPGATDRDRAALAVLGEVLAQRRR